jgi:Acyl-CoA dehydrogenase, C-terminal domain
VIDGAALELFERSIGHALDRHTGAALDAALAELGWHDALATDQRAAVTTLFTRQGAANATSSALDWLLVSSLGVEGVLVLPALGCWHPPGEVDGKRLRVHGLSCPSLGDRAVVVATANEKDVAFDAPVADLAVRPVHGVDPWLGLLEVTGETVRADTQPVIGWEAAVALGQLALGHELVGASRTMLELAREHALQRIQFGRPIAAFQAIRHRLADSLVAIEAADAVLDAAWLDQSPQTAAMAKAVAGRSARTAARHCQQVLAGIGFTTEHALHRYVRRVLVLDQLLGSSKVLTRELGSDVIASRKLPPLLPL